MGRVKTKVGFLNGLGYIFFFNWVGSKSGYSIGWGVGIQISRLRILVTASYLLR